MSAPLNPSCPSGGQWFACTSGSLFVGCCTQTDACGSNGCSAGNIKAASFNSAAYGQYKDQQCPSSAQWYTCQNAKPPFMGCCKSNPCSNGCPQADLAAGILDSSNHNGYVTGSAANSSSMSSSVTTTRSAAAASNSAATTTTAGPSVGYLGTATTTDSAAQMSPQSTGLSVGAIAGIVVGGFAALALILGAIIWFCLRHARDSRERHFLTRPSEHHPVAEPAEFMYHNSKSPGKLFCCQVFASFLVDVLTISAGYSAIQKPSPSDLHPYYDSRNTFQGSPPPTYGQQYAELGAGIHPLIPSRSGTASPAEGDGLGMQFRTPRSRFSFAPSVPGIMSAEREMTTVELPDTPVGGRSTPRV